MHSFLSSWCHDKHLLQPVKRLPFAAPNSHWIFCDISKGCRLSCWQHYLTRTCYRCQEKLGYIIQRANIKLTLTLLSSGWRMCTTHERSVAGDCVGPVYECLHTAKDCFNSLKTVSNKHWWANDCRLWPPWPVWKHYSCSSISSFG
jgi:hypothetical protein